MSEVSNLNLVGCKKKKPETKPRPPESLSFVPSDSPLKVTGGFAGTKTAVEQFPSAMARNQERFKSYWPHSSERTDCQLVSIELVPLTSIEIC